MKKCILYLAALVLLLGCTKENCEKRIAGHNGKVFYASLQDAGSRTALNAYGNICWTKDDPVSVFSSITNEKYRFTGANGSQSGAIEKDDKSVKGDPLARNYAIYPYASGNAFVSEGVFNTFVPSAQTYRNASFGEGCYPMIAATQNIDDDQFLFKPFCGILKVKLYSRIFASVSKVEFRGNAGEAVAGSCIVTAAPAKDDKPTFAFSDANTVGTITLDCGESGVVLGTTPGEATEFLIAVPPVTFADGFTIKVTDTDGNWFEKSTANSVSFRSNVIQPMKAVVYSPVVDFINGTPILKNSNIIGLVKNSATGQGIPGVPVTDGYKYVKTDANGVYQMEGDPKCRIVYYSLPAGYEIPLDQNNYPSFFSPTPVDMSTVNRNDFVLTPSGGADADFTFIAIGDPQPSNQSGADRYKNETIKDIVNTLNASQAEGKFNNAIAMTLGDIVSNVPNLWPTMRGYMSNVQLASGKYLPFFQTIGNHDHNYGSNRYESQSAYINAMSPVDYSFNIGKAHIISMDNVMCTSSSGIAWSYYAGISNEQLEWLKADLATVENKSDKLVFICFHIPFGEKVKTNRVEKMKDIYMASTGVNYDETLSLLTQFHDACVFTGHRHTWRNIANKSYICQSGRPLYEYNPGAACGSWWSCHSNCDGVPNGYQIVDVRGNEVYDWTLKAVGKDFSEQMRVYDGNQIYSISTSKYSWYSTSNKCGSTSYSAPGYSDLKNSFVVSLWNGDDTYWKLELYQNGVKVGDLTKVPEDICDICAVSYFFGDHSSSQWNVYTDDTRHYWYFKLPEGQTPSTYSNWEIKATHTVPASGVVHHYSANTLQTTNTCF